MSAEPQTRHFHKQCELFIKTLQSQDHFYLTDEETAVWSDDMTCLRSSSKTHSQKPNPQESDSKITGLSTEVCAASSTLKSPFYNPKLMGSWLR